MAEKKMTRKEALTNVIRFLNEDEVYGRDNWIDEIEILEKMLTSINKQANRPKSKTSARIQNEKFYEEMYRKMCERKNHEPVTPKWVAENVRGVMSTQRAVWVAKIGMEREQIKEIRVKKDVFYALIDWEPSVEG